MSERKYTKEIPGLIYEYVKGCKDSWNVVQKEGTKMTPFADRMVNLPGYQGFLLYLRDNTDTSICAQTFFNWRDKEFADKEEWAEFMEAVEYMDLTQYVRLQNGGLSGSYNQGSVKMLMTCNHGMTVKKEEKEPDDKNQTINIIIKKDDVKGYDIQRESEAT